MADEFEPVMDPSKDPAWVTVLKEKVKQGRIRDPELRKEILEL